MFHIHPGVEHDHPLVDRQIRELALAGMITLRGKSEGESIVSYGLSSYGYDLRLGNVFKDVGGRECP